MKKAEGTVRRTAAQEPIDLIPTSAKVRVERLIASRQQFLGFLTQRLRDSATAEDILQSAYFKAIEHGQEIRDDDSTVAWFYRLLRNALIDHYRRSEVRYKADAQYASEIPLTYETELKATVC